MFFSAHDIALYRRLGRLHFTGQLRGDSLLLTVGGTIQRFAQTSLEEPVSLRDAESIQDLYLPPCERWEEAILAPQEFLLAQVQEAVDLPEDLVGVISTLSHAARLGLASNPSSILVESKFSGYLTLELHNLLPRPLRILPGDPVAKLKFALASPGVGDQGHYGAKGYLVSSISTEFPSEGVNHV